MKKLFLSLTLVTCLLTLSHCSKEDFSYEFSEGCSTGKQEYSSKEAMCEGLQSESRNNGCAPNLRRNHFKNNCPGTFTSTN